MRKDGIVDTFLARFSISDPADAPSLARPVQKNLNGGMAPNRGLLNHVDEDDKTCAYTIENYLRWGGHRREFASNGDEIHAETTRLYIKAHLKGARRVRADDAIAWPSRRKLKEDPVLHFATAGFPRERTWRRHWESPSRVRLNLQEFVDEVADETAGKAALVRRAHVLILFGVLPTYVAKLTGSESCQELAAEFSDLLPALAPLSRADLLNNSAILFERGFSLMETHWPLLMERVRA